MILDKLCEFDDSRAALTATAISTNVMDLGAVPTLRDLWAGANPVWFVVQCEVTGTGAGTVTITLQSDSVAGIDTTPHIHYTSPAIVGTDFVAGRVIVCAPISASSFLGAVPQLGPGFERYLGVKYTIASTVGAVVLSSFLTLNPQFSYAYPSGFTAS